MGDERTRAKHMQFMPIAALPAFGEEYTYAPRSILDEDLGDLRCLNEPDIVGISEVDAAYPDKLDYSGFTRKQRTSPSAPLYQRQQDQRWNTHTSLRHGRHPITWHPKMIPSRPSADRAKPCKGKYSRDVYCCKVVDGEWWHAPTSEDARAVAMDPRNYCPDCWKSENNRLHILMGDSSNQLKSHASGALPVRQKTSATKGNIPTFKKQRLANEFDGLLSVASVFDLCSSM